jgi:hypothetical protein
MEARDWHNNPRADSLREALREIADLKSLTATPTQFYQHLQRIACRALTADAMAEPINADATDEPRIDGYPLYSGLPPAMSATAVGALRLLQGALDALIPLGRDDSACEARGYIIAARRQLLEWAVSRWRDEVSLRPLVNKHRRTLDDTWRQVIRYAGGDPVALIGPAHDDLVLAQGPFGKGEPT